MSPSSKYQHPTTLGYMPLKSSYGFLTPQATTRDAAHELGHGKFNLRHTFSQHNVVYLPEGSTQNLMDYPSTGSGQATGTELLKYQWDFIHNPEGGWFVFEDWEEGAMNSANKDKIIKILNEIRETNLSGASYAAYSEEIELKGEDIQLGDNTYDFVSVSLMFTNYDCNYDNEEQQMICEIANNTTLIRRSVYSISNNDEQIKLAKYQFGYYIYSGDQEPQKNWNEFYISVTENNSDDLEKYLCLDGIPKFDVKKIEESAEDAINLANSYGCSSCCNICTRAAVYKITGQSILFPEVGNWIGETGESEYLKGKVKYEDVGAEIHQGNANSIAKSLELGHVDEFTPLPNIKGKNIPDFGILQQDANDGQIIIGTLFNEGVAGHVVMIVPASMNEIVKRDIDGINTYVPLILECGSDRRFVSVNLTTGLRKDDIIRMKWYKYIP